MSRARSPCPQTAMTLLPLVLATTFDYLPREALVGPPRAGRFWVTLMLEITPEDIAELDDADLRTLIGRLCEAELASRGLPVSSVTWGGDQRAADGGVDVRVALPEGASAGD